MKLQAIICESREDAIIESNFQEVYGVPVLLNGKPMLVRESDAARLEKARVSFAYLHYHEPSGLIMTVPAN